MTTGPILADSVVGGTSSGGVGAAASGALEMTEVVVTSAS
eukprot:CAMPEP_0119304350 /NCGR_PEP_ID=MMETSP1333-20130426/5587_1 /TAXON_ID=418940 /ORGANISM="Scyphosphaera apsteinii, Strain RCC1455" /LENGTH=39 /DNA_ID= /DNA_START= /DNA_END= /DNA_ORIENTATION=